jgi:vitamin B12 transporter
MQRHFKTAAIAAAVLSTFNVYAVDESVGPEVVVTATRQAQRADELLADVTLIDREEIERAGPTTTLADLVGRQAGVQLTSNGGPGTTSGLLIRGANAEHTLVLVDGLRINSATLGSTSLSRIPLAQIDHIEILRGPASALYGSEAIGGVVQIFTKRGDGPAQWFAEASAGSYGTSDTNIGVSGGSNGWKYNFSADRFHTDGFSAIRNRSNSAYNPDKDGFSRDSLAGSFSYSPVKGHEYGLDLFRSDGSNRYDGGFSPTSAARDYFNDNSVVSYAGWSRNRILPSWTSTIRIGHGTDDSTNRRSSTPNTAFRTDQNQMSWQNDVALPVGTALFAVERTLQKVETSTAYSTNQRRLNAVLLGWNGGVGDHHLQVNLRRDTNSQFGSKDTGVFAYGYQIAPAWRASVSAGTAFKAPTFNDLYYPNTPFVGAGNPNLRPETSRNREASLHYEEGNHGVGLTYYRNRIKDLIQWEETPPGSFFYMPQNVAAAELEGWTLAYDGRLSDYALHASLDKLDPRDTATGLQLLRRARTTGNLSASRDFGKWKLTAEIQAVGARYNDVANTQHLGGYALGNLDGAYALSNEWSLFARANNLFDKRYEQVADFATAGANIFAGIRYTSK